MDFNTLPTVAALSDAVTICEYQGIKIVRINHAQAEAGISLHGGHLIWFKPQGEEDVIWLSEKAEFDTEKAIRGGIPVCWPWFGKAATPSHGFARNSEWNLLEHRENDNGVIVALTLCDSEATRKIWPHKFSNVLTFEIGTSLKVSLASTNTDDTAWHYSGALHTYFSVANIRETHITQMGSEYADSTQADQICQGGEQLSFDGEVDRVYTQPEPTVMIHDSNSRQIAVTNGGHNTAVIWNPWQALSQSMGDMADNSFETMVCVESTIHNNQSITLAPGETHTLTTEVSVKR
ncbi:D-hexose-6-phosphate mutarotase [Photobacterium lutimaris]|uniref:Putative glucose-6-phosphate 1-epimerase n=1 Tax=Photobacterium lutimaris TaxID=388278 RepID=A0A2T3IVG0_9GAMM|nr:D-hexose-6-phosphate mutarotase [Photobacterium lutimaris]PSU32409.1 D-hexose-6-phosphate mutarotase [Photobacterium lutimaris]TDR77609.1 glucose-6-phosphate 1-epimerase [Photobacterium lutimaris]